MIVSVLSVIIIPNIEIVRFRMDGAVRGSVAALVSAQRQAVNMQHDIVVAFDTVSSLLRIHEDADNDGAVDDGERVRVVPFDDGVVFGLDGATALFGSTTVAFTETQNGDPVVRFIRNGSASEDGHFYLTSDRAVATAGHPHDTRAVKIDRATGRVTWYYYDSSDQWQKGF